MGTVLSYGDSSQVFGLLWGSFGDTSQFLLEFLKDSLNSKPKFLAFISTFVLCNARFNYYFY